MEGSVWMHVSELAAQRGVSKQAISKRIARLEAIGAIETRRGERGTKLAEFDRAAGEATDAIRELNGVQASPPGAAQAPFAEDLCRPRRPMVPQISRKGWRV